MRIDSIEPTPIIVHECDKDMGWGQTPVGQNVTINGGCYNGTVDG